MARHPASPSPAPPAVRERPRTHAFLQTLMLASALALAVGAAHAPVLRANAVGLDDDLFVVHNPLVSNPGWESVRRFFVEVVHPSTVDAYYLPLSMTSLMIDESFGGTPDHLAPFHVTSLALHVAATLTLFLLLQRLFGAVLPAALAALLFGVHPVNVEAIASVGERKTVLAAWFAFASVYAHVRFAERAAAAWRWASVGLYALALLSKPSVITLPAGLLLLDAWPLRRSSRASVLEKWPHVLLALALSVITLLAYRNTWVFETPPPLDPVRMALQALWLQCFYAVKLLWPVGLSTVYASPAHWTLAAPAVALPVAGVLAVGGLLVLLRRRAPAALAAASLFVVLLAPTFGILRFSPVIACDRYLYLPALGVAFGLAAVFARVWRTRGSRARVALVAVALGVAFAEAAGTRTAIAAWQDTLGLWQQAVHVAPGMPDSYNGLGATYSARGDSARAMAAYRRAIELDPTYADAQFNLGRELILAGRAEEAVPHLEYAALRMPGSARVALELGVGYARTRRLAEAAARFRQALTLKPGYALAYSQLGVVEIMLGHRDAGERQLREALALSPRDPGTCFTLAALLVQESGASPEAIELLRTAVAGKPRFAEACNLLAWLLATTPVPSLREPAEALRWSRRSLELSGPDNAHVLDTHAAALAAAGRFDSAAAVAEHAAALSEAGHDDTLARSIRARLRGYRGGQAYVDRGEVLPVPPR
jgi:tetratricopeptide (TPR) repeat protein